MTAEHRAWRILLGSFVVFVLLCASLIYGIQWFLFQSTVTMDVTVTAARGTIQIAPPNSQAAAPITDRPSDLDIGSNIKTDQTSQAVVTFADPETGRPRAYLFVLRDSQVRLRKAEQPRFTFNRATHAVDVSSPTGKSYMVIVDNQERPLEFTFSSSHGTVTTLQTGQYAFEVTDNWTKVSVLNGEANLTTGRDDSPLHLSSSQHGYLSASAQEVNHPIVDRSLVINGQFTEIYSAGWRAYSVGEPAGEVTSADFEGRNVVTINRGQAKWPNMILDHGETGLVQAINADVSKFDSLELQTTFYVEEQSLSTCGVVGSECPLMLRVVYTDSAGVERVYIHGFFALYDPGAGYPLLCDTCRAEHERVRVQTWYTYSDNLFALLPPEQRPQFIREISLYASGHAYVVHIAQMDLVVTQLRPPEANAQ